MTLGIVLLGLAALVAVEPGKEVFEKRCTGCHALDENRMGPKLRGVFGAKAAGKEGFPYSDALKAAGVVWDARALDRWLTDPDALVPGNDMSFRVPRVEERVAIVEFLKNLKR